MDQVMKLYKKNTPCFDDILLVPQYSEIISRKSVDVSTSIGSGKTEIELKLPVIAAPMDTVCEQNMAYEISKLGGLGIIHRYMSIDDQSMMVKNVSDKGEIVGAAVGATSDYLERAKINVKSGASVILVDIANGHSVFAINAIKEIRRTLGESLHIMAGNVATSHGFIMLQEAGANSIRVGIGGGAVCTTRLVSGHGIPTLSSILDVRERLEYGYGSSIIADGGIKNSGDAVKALAAGANAVMLGSYLSGTDESPGEVYRDGEKKFKIFRGMASAEAQKDFSGKVSVSEGVETTVPYKGSAIKLIEDFKLGIGSGLSYSGVSSLKELYEESQYVNVSSLTVNESRPHAAHIH